MRDDVSASARTSIEVGLRVLSNGTFRIQIGGVSDELCSKNLENEVRFAVRPTVYEMIIHYTIYSVPTSSHPKQSLFPNQFATSNLTDVLSTDYVMFSVHSVLPITH